jgi:nitrogen fixation protein NifB
MKSELPSVQLRAPDLPALQSAHPCFDERAHARVGRVHLPVAPRCNIQCAYCERRVCASLTMQHPGWAQRRLSVAEALVHVDQLVEAHHDEPFVVGIAGPGESLANAETLEVLQGIHRRHPALMTCLSTNGLLLVESLPELLAAGICALTVTVNTLDAKIGQRIYAWVRYGGTTFRGRAASELLIARQLAGVKAAVSAGLLVKVNTVLMPGINDQHLVPLAQALRQAGVHMMNIMPLLPASSLRDHPAPTCLEINQARSACEQILPQFRLCEHCRADVECFPMLMP